MTWRNIYRSTFDDSRLSVGYEHDSPQEARRWREGIAEFLRVEIVFDGNPMRTPVGMRSDRASHIWFFRPDGKAECLFDRKTMQIALGPK